VVGQVDGALLVEGGGEGAAHGDGVGGEGGAGPWQALEAAGLHEEGGPTLPLQGRHHRLAMAVAPGAVDPVQGDPVAEQDSVGGPWPG